MKKLILILVFALLVNGNAFGETLDEKRNQYIYNNLSFEYSECQHYYLIVSEALKTNNPDPKVIQDYLSASKSAGDIAFVFGQEAGLTVEAMLARTKISVDQMLKSMNNNYANISVLFVKYQDLCEGLLKNPDIRNQYWINRAYEKIK